MILQEIWCLVCVCVHMHIWMLCMECLLHFSFYLIYLFINSSIVYLLIVDTGSLTECGVYSLSLLHRKLHESIYLCLPVLGLQMCGLHPTFYMGSGNWGSGLHACKAFTHGVISLPWNLATLRRDKVSNDAWRMCKIQETGCAVPIAPASGLHTFWNLTETSRPGPFKI